MAKIQHGNLHTNLNLHHLYVIYDFQEQEIYKFGISDKPVSAILLSSRIANQVTLFNRVAGIKRFKGRIISYPIQGRLPARKLEDDWILKFKNKHNHFPRGNQNHQFLKT